MNKARSPILAAMLSLLATGLGQVYCGRLRRGALLFLAYVLLPLAPLLLADQAADTGALLLVAAAILLAAGINLFSIIDAHRAARRAPADYQLKRYNSWFGYTLFLLAAFAYSSLVNEQITEHYVQAFQIPTGSMEPSILPGDRILVSKQTYKHERPRHGDIVVFSYPQDPSMAFIKRVVGVPGETVEIRDQILLRNGAPVPQSDARPTQGGELRQEGEPGRNYPLLLTADCQDKGDYPPVTVPADALYLLGDNRCNSFDSRHFGPIPLTALKGRATFRYFPKQDWRRFGRIE